MKSLHKWFSAAIAAIVLPGAQDSVAQTTLTVSSVVNPGSSVAATVSGPPGHFFAVIGSPVNSGLTHGGIALGVGADFVILGYGVLDSTGQVTVEIMPPFDGSTLDRYYLQAGTSPSPTFLPLTVSARRVVLNGDLIAGLMGPPGPQGPPGPRGESVISGGSTTATSMTSGLLTPCVPTVVASIPITLASSSKVFSVAQGIYLRGGTALQGVVIRSVLRDSTQTVVATSLGALGTLASLDDPSVTVVDAVVLKVPVADPSEWRLSTDYVAEPGIYTLQMVGEATNGPCATGGLIPILQGTLTYLLVGLS